MPRIDDTRIQKKIFQKQSFRSWESNLLDKLKVHSESTEKEKELVTSKGTTNVINGEKKPEINQIATNKKGSEQEFKSSKLEFKKGDKTTGKEFKGSTQGSNIEFNSSIKEPSKSSRKDSFEPQKPELSNFSQNKKEQTSLEKMANVVSSTRDTLDYKLKNLRGNEQKIFFFVLNICLDNNSNNAGEISANDIDVTLQMPRNSRETSIKRLVKKGLLLRGKGKRGAGSILSLGLPELVKETALKYLAYYSDSKLEFNQRVNKESNFPIYSSNYINNNNTTGIYHGLSEEWSMINIEPLKNIGFSFTQLKQLCSKELNEPEAVQDSILHFAFGLENNPKFKNYSDPLNVLMGVLRKGGIWVEANYRSPKEIAMKKLIEQKKAEKERLKKLEEEAYDLAFDEWRSSLTEEKETEIRKRKEGAAGALPPNIKLAVYFKENVWEKIKEKYLIG